MSFSTICWTFSSKNRRTKTSNGSESVRSSHHHEHVHTDAHTNLLCFSFVFSPHQRTVDRKWHQKQNWWHRRPRLKTLKLVEELTGLPVNIQMASLTESSAVSARLQPERTRKRIQKIPLASLRPFCFIRGSVELATCLDRPTLGKPLFIKTKS